MTAEGGNMTLQTEGTSGTNQSVARNDSAGGGGIAPSQIKSLRSQSLIFYVPNMVFADS